MAVEPSTFTYDLDTNVGLIRLLINDKYQDDPIFYDEEIGAFYALEGSNVKLAAAKAFETIAADEALVQKVIKLLSLSTDGTKVAAELRANAAALRSQVEVDPNGQIDIAEWVVDTFSAREHIFKDWLRIG